MANEDIVQHSFRLNLNNPRDLKLHQAIMSASMEIYKSKNNYIRKAAYRGIFGESESLESEEEIVDLSQLATKKELENAEKRIKDSIMQEMFGMMLTSMAGRTPVVGIVPKVEEQEDAIDDAVADAALGYF